MKFRINKMKCGKNDIGYYLAFSTRNKSTVSTTNLFRIAKHSELVAQGITDIDGYLKDFLDNYTSENLYDLITLKFDPNKKITRDSNASINAGHLFIKRIFDDLDFDKLFKNISNNYRLTYSLSDVVFFLISERIIYPDSKIGMYYNALNKSLITPSFKKDSIYRALDVIEDNKDIILKHCYEHSPKGVKRDRHILYYDCTNTYFESEVEDGLRKRGHGKRNEKEPLVSLGLAMDASGIPLSYTVFQGSQNEQKTLIPLEKEIMEDFRNASFVIITDAGLSSKENRCFNSIANRKYITTLPVRKMSEDKLDLYIFDTKKEWITTDPKFKCPDDIKNEYQRISKLLEYDPESKVLKEQLSHLLEITLYRRYPVNIDEKPKKYITKDDKEKGNIYIDEDYLISYSLKYELRQKKKRSDMIIKAESMLKKPGRISHAGINDPKQYIERISASESTGEIAKDYYQINTELIIKQEKLDGYYCVCTNLLDDDNETIINAMKYRWFIEDSFKIMKQYFNFRPVGHELEKRIKAHFFTCFLSLLVYRYIQIICHSSPYNSLKKITDENLLNTIKSYILTKFKNSFYLPSFSLTDEIDEMEELFNVHLSREIIIPSMIKKEISKKR